MYKNVLLILVTVLAGCTAHDGAGHSKYAGEESREIKSLSPDDIAELRRGDGWGLAKAAELNGVPGPAHLLELSTEVGLSEAQVGAIEGVHRQMRADAIVQGERLIALEEELEAQFQSRAISADELRVLLDTGGEIRAGLRFVHLAAHLEMLEILTDEQIERYNTLRGYGSGDPCENVPEGHDAALWRKHNGCE